MQRIEPASHTCMPLRSVVPTHFWCFPAASSTEHGVPPVHGQLHFIVCGGHALWRESGGKHAAPPMRWHGVPSPQRHTCGRGRGRGFGARVVVAGQAPEHAVVPLGQTSLLLRLKRSFAWHEPIMELHGVAPQHSQRQRVVEARQRRETGSTAAQVTPPSCWHGVAFGQLQMRVSSGAGRAVVVGCSAHHAAFSTDHTSRVAQL